MPKTKHKPYTEMNTRELAEATCEFNEPFVMDRGRPLNAKERLQHRRAAQRGRGRPRIGGGSVRVNFTIGRELLKSADAMAKASGRNRSELLADGLKLLLARKAS
jgi:hypothetical protein